MRESASRVDVLIWDQSVLRPVREAVSKATGMPLDIIDSEDRTQDVAQARHIAFFLSRELGISYPRIGRVFGLRDHTTVMHGVKKIQNQMLSDATVRRTVTAIRKRVMAIKALESVERKSA